MVKMPKDAEPDDSLWSSPTTAPSPTAPSPGTPPEQALALLRRAAAVCGSSMQPAYTTIQEVESSECNAIGFPPGPIDRGAFMHFVTAQSGLREFKDKKFPLHKDVLAFSLGTAEADDGSQVIAALSKAAADHPFKKLLRKAAIPAAHVALHRFKENSSAMHALVDPQQLTQKQLEDLDFYVMTLESDLEDKKRAEEQRRQSILEHREKVRAALEKITPAFAAGDIHSVKNLEDLLHQTGFPSESSALSYMEGKHSLDALLLVRFSSANAHTNDFKKLLSEAGAESELMGGGDGGKDVRFIALDTRKVEVNKLIGAIAAHDAQCNTQLDTLPQRALDAVKHHMEQLNVSPSGQSNIARAIGGALLRFTREIPFEDGLQYAHLQVGLTAEGTRRLKAAHRPKTKGKVGVHDDLVLEVLPTIVLDMLKTELRLARHVGHAGREKAKSVAAKMGTLVEETLNPDFPREVPMSLPARGGFSDWGGR